MITQTPTIRRMICYQKGTPPHPPTPEKYFENVQINSPPKRRNEVKT
jgi:hypothetical protein